MLLFLIEKNLDVYQTMGHIEIHGTVAKTPIGIVGNQSIYRPIGPT